MNLHYFGATKSESLRIFTEVLLYPGTAYGNTKGPEAGPKIDKSLQFALLTQGPKKPIIYHVGQAMRQAHKEETVKMNLTNFNRFYIRNESAAAFGYDRNTEMQQHVGGAKLHVETVTFENYFMATFDNGLQVSIEYKNGVMTLATEDKIRRKDLIAHPGYAGNKELLIKIYIRWVVGRIATPEQIAALVDLALNLDLN